MGERMTVEARVIGHDGASMIALIALQQTEIRIPFLDGVYVCPDGSEVPAFGLRIFRWDGREVDDDGRPVFR
jgi:hypothetical protein